MRSKLVILLLSVLAICIDAEFEDFCTLSGTIKGLSDFSSIYVKLLNKQGNLREKTEVSESGFFVLPIYDKGEYEIRIDAPAGYSFDPELIKLNFDGINDICTKKKDVNFNFKGFGITGKVNIFNEPSFGAKKVNIKLFNAKTQQEMASTVSDEAGVFTFSPIVPGSYRVVASHESWHFSKSEHLITVSTGNTKLPDGALMVSGFNLIGKVAQPTITMGFLIFNAKGQKNVHQCDEKLPSGKIGQAISSNFEGSPFCYTSQIKNGEFVFRNLASGRYLIVPQIDTSKIEFHISPSSIEAEIQRENFKLTEVFEISGFTATGRVLKSQQKPEGIGGATIKLNGKVFATTDASGSYTLKNIKDGAYTIQVNAQDLQFQDHTVKVSMANPTVPEIYVSGFKVCGKVVSEQSFKVSIKKQGSSSTTEVASDPKDSGNFCTFLGNGRYSFEVVIDASEKKNVQFYPIQHPIEVASGAISDIIFSQLRAKVNGKVSCMSDEDNTCKSVEITLSALDENGYRTSTQSTKTKNGVYAFEEILPGRYELSVPSENLCWEQQQQSFVVKSAVENVPNFIHNGFKIGPIISSHDTKASYTRRTSGEEKSIQKSDIQLTSGANVLCVPKSGTYELKVSGCHVFEEDTKVLSTKATTPIHINAVKHKNGIRILSEIDQVFSIDAEFENGSKKVLKPIKQAEKVDGYVAYNINMDLKAGERVTLSPKSEQMLFKPVGNEWKGAIDCVDVAVNFIATKGLVVTGKTEPLIENVQVTLSFPKNPELPPISTKTSKNGEFKFPTIDPTIDYDLKAEKESYIFSDYDTTKNIFHSHKLCEIIVKVEDETAKELSGVVISLSGGENYRKNLGTGANGEIKFHSLMPGKYYLRAMMKEYDFKPNSQTIEIKDGETKNIDLKGKRVAYSVFGKITTLSGDPFGNVKVEASTTEACSNHQEEAVTEPSGQYRIRGLQTGCDYKIHLQKNSNVDRSIPPARTIKVNAVDTENVNFIAINPINICDVIVKVKCKNNEHYKTLKIQMYKRDSPDSPVYSQRIESLMMPKSKENENILVHMPRISGNDYQKVFFIEIRTSLSDSNYKFTLPSIQFTANTSSIYHVIEFNPILKQPETELNKNSLIALLLIFLVGFTFLKHELVFDMVSNMWMKFSSDLTSRQPLKKAEGKVDKFVDVNEIDQLTSFIEAGKKKKSKKNN